jgi:diguanylate cyclase (GGDEF)-like protein
LASLASSGHPNGVHWGSFDQPEGETMPIRNRQALPVQSASPFHGFDTARLTRASAPVPFKKHAPVDGLEEALTSALLAGDNELGQIVHEVDEISKILRADAPDCDSLRVAKHPAVWSAVKHALLERELRYLALTDDLTCLYNRRAFFAAATHQLKLARRNAQTMHLIFCDLDDLKRINDTFGHREGDLAILRAADALDEAFRDSDILSRIGGDEFAVLAVTQSDECAGVLLDRLDRSLKKSNANEPRYTLSLSVGAARFDPKKPASLGELMAQADKAMYERKRGKLQTSVYHAQN